MQSEEHEMSHWNYRVVKRCSPDHPDEPAYQIHEVYYNDQGEPDAFTVDAVAPLGETPEELKADLQAMLRALDAPVLEYAVLDEATKATRRGPEQEESFKSLAEVKAELGL
jgi:hypothetical protein